MEINKLNSLIELFFRKCDEVDHKKPFLKWLKPGKQIYNWGDIRERIFKLSFKIKSLINTNNFDDVITFRPEWLISDIAVMNAGGISVPIFTTYSSNDYEYILNDCKPTLIIISNDNQFQKIKKNINLDRARALAYAGKTTESLLMQDILNEENHEEIINKKLKRNMPACIIYTSGTSGNPKGVVLSHGGILSNCEGAVELLKPLIKKKNPVFLTWLPLSHSYEHTVQFIQIIISAEIYYAESLEKLISNMGIAKPTIMTAVPRFYQNLYTKINMSFEKQKGIKKIIINITLNLVFSFSQKRKIKFYRKNY